MIYRVSESVPVNSARNLSKIQFDGKQNKNNHKTNKREGKHPHCKRRAFYFSLYILCAMICFLCKRCTSHFAWPHFSASVGRVWRTVFTPRRLRTYSSRCVLGSLKRRLEGFANKSFTPSWCGVKNIYEAMIAPSLCEILWMS